MFNLKTLFNRWMRRYRTFFIIGLLILILQLYLAYRSFKIHVNSKNEFSIEESEFRNFNLDVGDENSARRIKDGYLIDDEDNLINSIVNDKIKVKKPPDKVDDIKSTQPKLNKTVLRTEELDFVPICEIRTKEAISAIHRAKTQHCKQMIVNLTCLIQNDKLYPKNLPNYCSKGDFHAGKSLGCFKDEKAFRILNGYYANYKQTNSPEHCIRMCLQSGFTYAGVQYSTECFCGNNEPPSTARLPDSSCNMKCPTNPRDACGGYFTINIYQTGISVITPAIAETTTQSGTVPVRIVYLLTLNGRAVRQVRRLIKSLFHVNNYFYIHVDARQDYLFRELLSLEDQFVNIKLARHRFATIWGGASLLQMLIASMRDLLQSNWKWDYIINLSESDFPVKTSEKLVEFLTSNRGKNFVKSHGREVQRFIQKQGLDKTFIECDAHMWRTGDRKLPWGIQIDGGSDWVALSRPFVEYVATETQDLLVEGLSVVFKYTLLPAESFFHTVLRNSKFCKTYVDNNLHVTNWKRKLGCKCQYKHVVDWCGCSPNDFKPDDWNRILITENRQLYFARKFEPVVNQAIILQLEQWLYGPYLLNVTNINSYWQSVYHTADLNPQSDDGIITISTSLTRIYLKSVVSDGCFLTGNQLIEVSSYHHNDVFKGVLITYEVTTEENKKIVLEMWVKLSTNLKINKSTALLKRLKSFYVSSEFDQKEQIARNFGRFLGPFSEPVLVYEFLPSISTNTNNYNVTFLWINPIGELAETSECFVDVNYLLNFIKPVFKQPLLPGVWIVKLIHKNNLLAQTSFLVTPLEFYSKISVSQTQAAFIHGGNTDNLLSGDWDMFLKNKTERLVLQTKAISNAKRFGLDLQEWIDSLVVKFYSIQGTCIAKWQQKLYTDEFRCGKVRLESCTKLFWSSFSLDPKSNISAVDGSSGRLK